MVGQYVLAVVQTRAPDDPQKVILSGLDAYKTDGPEAAIILSCGNPRSFRQKGPTGLRCN
jgi:hypothetical protein